MMTSSTKLKSNVRALARMLRILNKATTQARSPTHAHELGPGVAIAAPWRQPCASHMPPGTRVHLHRHLETVRMVATAFPHDGTASNTPTTRATPAASSPRTR
ncbi:hypothetical protein PTSG_08737 [Salpingoeca rosetta]|uniref:Uncharacterized protein n=1 Tax=Salpingoeca rosetta (strain ATCC 50818 / BSB-021) TaxID=946362 RepID=F2UKJ6_SALR5|nr:uncharacterized protein PTSG_08737 [Salpingoeca rosetta]EGD77645.1 hypothetical protein PTSG_08737 [Salpingoeca rosetta]|eukprot:XP_004990121.1 hypothetical protein PTSG_08737 [Salpingoeca rosetta]